MSESRLEVPFRQNDGCEVAPESGHRRLQPVWNKLQREFEALGCFVPLLLLPKAFRETLQSLPRSSIYLNSRVKVFYSSIVTSGVRKQKWKWNFGRCVL
jgi:hypothetical protein